MWRGVAEAAPDRAAVVCGDRGTTFEQFDDRASLTAGASCTRRVLEHHRTRIETRIDVSGVPGGVEHAAAC